MTQDQADSQAPAAVGELHRPQVPYNFFSVSSRQRDVCHMARDQEACGAEQIFLGRNSALLSPGLRPWEPHTTGSSLLGPFLCKQAWEGYSSHPIKDFRTGAPEAVATAYMTHTAWGMQNLSGTPGSHATDMLAGKETPNGSSLDGVMFTCLYLHIPVLLNVLIAHVTLRDGQQ